MKAKEYFTKYEQNIMSSDQSVSNRAFHDMAADLVAEVQQLIKVRDPKKPSGLAGILREVNQKFNAIGRLFKEKYGESILATDGFLTYWDATFTIPDWLRALL